MADLETAPFVNPDAAAAPLTQGQRVMYTFTAPSKTFTDILRSRSCWLPILLSFVFSYVFIFAMTSKIGWDKLSESAMKQNPAQMERINNMPPDQRAAAMKTGAIFTKGITLGFPVLGLLITAITSLVLWGTINFGFGGKATYGEVFVVWIYANLVLIVKSLLGAVSLFAGLDSESFNLQNPIGTNIGYYLPPDLPKWVLSLGSWFDVVTIWQLILVGIGIAIVAKVKRSSGLIAVFGWWIIIMLGSVGIAAATS